MVCAYKKLANCFPKWQYHFTFTLAINEGSSRSAYSVNVQNLVVRIVILKSILSYFFFNFIFLFYFVFRLWLFFIFIFLNFILFFSFIFISWRLSTLQYCSGFCHTLTWISHGFTCVPHPDLPSHLPLHPIPLILVSLLLCFDIHNSYEVCIQIFCTIHSWIVCFCIFELIIYAFWI